jgi:hypothetical protein
MGLLDWKAYGEFLREIDLALSLMYTPHPSYPPFDVAACGGVVISNRCMNKVDFPYSKNVILSDLDEKTFLSDMQRAVELAKDMEKRKVNYGQSTIARSWKKTLNSLIGRMGEMI